MIVSPCISICRMDPVTDTAMDVAEVTRKTYMEKKILLMIKN